MRANKSLLVLVSVLILPVSLLWGGLYVGLGAPSGLFAVVYLAISVASIALFARTRDCERPPADPAPRHPHRADDLDGPAGRLPRIRRVGLWGLLAPLGALVFNGVRPGARWYVAFVVLFLGSGIAGTVIGPDRAGPGVVRERDPGAQRRGRWHRVLHPARGLLQPTPGRPGRPARRARAGGEPACSTSCRGSIAERLKARPETIADGFREVSVLFADVVEFTPRAEQARRRRRSSASSIDCSAISTSSPSGTTSRRSRPSATRTWSPRASPTAAGSRPRAGAPGARHGRERRTRRRGRRPRARAADRDQLRPRRRRRHRPQALPVRPVGRRGEHREPHGIARARPAASRSPARPTSCSRDEFVCEPRGTSRSRARATWRPGTCSGDEARSSRTR